MDRTAEELKRRLEAQREEVGRDLIVIGDRISPGRMAERGQARMRQRAHRIRERVMGTVEDGRHQVSGTASSMGDSAHDLARRTRESPEHLAERVEGNPIAAGFIAFGLGLLAASLIPATRREQELASQAQPRLEEAAGEVAETAKDMATDLRSSAEAEMAVLGDEARDAARVTAGAAREHAGPAADELRSDVGR